MILNEKSLNYKFINLDEIYNFHTTFISIRTQTKNYDFLETDLSLPPSQTAAGTATLPARYR